MRMNKKQKKMLIRIIITAVMVIVLNFISITGFWQFMLYLAAYLIIGSAFSNFPSRSTFA